MRSARSDGRRRPFRRFNMEDVPLESAKLGDTGTDRACLTLTEEIYGYEAPVRFRAPPEDGTLDMK